MKKIMITLCMFVFLFTCNSDDSEEEDCFVKDQRCASTSQCCTGLSCQVGYYAGSTPIYVCK